MKAAIAVFGFLISLSAFGYGPDGHHMVGAIADARLSGTPTAAKLRAIIPDLTLQEAAVVPDQIKAWDRRGPDAPHMFRFQKASQADLQQQLLDFWHANPPAHNNTDTRPSHHWFHYTDVPVAGGEKYGDGPIGRNPWDLVHMIPYCVRVLQGHYENNPRKITKPIAVMLLAHYMGDIHQPLHVGAEYFDSRGRPYQPTPEIPGADDEGGNSISLVLQLGSTRSYKLHGFWDEQAVSVAMSRIRAEIKKVPGHSGVVRNDEIASYLAKREPANWTIPASVSLSNWSVYMANEILPVAAEAHSRLEFSNMHGTKRATGVASPKASANPQPYEQWAGTVVQTEVHKAGWRLAELLERALK